MQLQVWAHEKPATLWPVGERRACGLLRLLYAIRKSERALDDDDGSGALLRGALPVPAFGGSAGKV